MIDAEKVYKINEKYNIVVKDNSIQIIYIPNGRVLKQYTQEDGYVYVYLYPIKYFTKQPKAYPVHELVGKYVLEGYEKGLTVAHIDGVKTNNHPSNLKYVTKKAKVHHARATGLANSKAYKKLKAENRAAIKRAYKDLSYIKHLSERAASRKDRFAKGGRIEHSTLGLGTILTLEAGSAIIEFDSGQTKKIKLEFLK